MKRSIASAPARRRAHYLYLIALGLIALLAGCSPDPDQQNYRNIAVDLTGVEQRFACSDGGSLFASFSRDGMSVELHLSKNSEPVALSAPAPNLTFVGDDINATFREGRAYIETVNAPAFTCVKP